MLDDYSLRLLAEIGIDVHVPRRESVGMRHEAPSPVVRSLIRSVAPVVPVESEDSADVLVLCGPNADGKLLQDLLRALRMTRLGAAIADGSAGESIARARGLVVLGESLARTIGADMPAQRQNEIFWVVTREMLALARDAAAKRALWGEIKRLSRSVATARCS
ncbi:MAG: hypothetical protein WAS23_12775 [Dokdonella sp.]|uniref:hypothetical protein n=1 Tax=Dokdonella sp. TaxID=2291710 RepID=UPI002C48ADEA|nr:hypothetical protein [Dokdonella sp.]HOX72060.1 hypothetical protein [Dokdonella sp.]HPG94798.1 hypothetical protein [Dokdonella sp.]HPN78433.1 hypothetical protein [Dokdonella sp.]